MTLAAFGISLFFAGIAQAQKGGKGGGGGGVGDKGPSYQVIKLDTDDGAGGTLSGCAWDINDSRLIVGSVDELAAFWTVTDVDGELQSKLRFLDSFPFIYSTASGCNGWGEIVGQGDYGLAAVYWASTGSAAVELPAPLPFRVARAINNSGVICGESGAGAGADQKALAWSFTGGKWVYLELTPLGDPGEDEQGTPRPNQAVAIAVSEEDPDTGVITIAGESNGNAVLWTVMTDGSGGLLAGPTMILDYGEAAGLNNTGTVCGTRYNGGAEGVVWIDGGPAEPLDPYRVPSYTNPQTVLPHDVNDSGLIVGGTSLGFSAVIWPNKDAALISLNDYLPKRKSPFSSLTDAWAVNESNEIVGNGSLDGVSPLLPFLAVPE
jgi:hypothetical protein